MKRGLWAVFIILIFSVSSALAQAECPADVLLAHARTGGICNATERGTFCYGNGAVTAQLRSADAEFVQPADRVPTDAIDSVTLDSGDEWSVAAMRLQTSIADVDQRSIFTLMFGDVQMDNLVPVVPELLVIGLGTVNLRSAPLDNADILDSIGIRGELTANGRTEDGIWLRVIVPDQAAFAWVTVEGVTTQGDLTTLNIVTGDDPYFRPFQQMTLRTGADDARCEGAPESGVLIQTPNLEDENILIIDGVTVRLAGTAFVQAADTLTVDVLNGYALLDEQYIPAGARSQAALEPVFEVSAAIGFEAETIALLPINFLEYRFPAAVSLTSDEIAEQTATFFAPPEVAANAPPRCLRLTTENVQLHSGPGTTYPVTYTVAASRRVYPLTQATGDDGAIWWQLRGGNWMRASRAESRGECAEIPITGQEYIAESRTNILSLETCTTSNGPLIAGQYVTIEFVPRAWETIADALDAPRRDWGRIEVGEEYLYVDISDPIQIAIDRWVRVFSAGWTAEAGTFRIEGSRLAYERICNVTIAVR
jgi:hypothetical protein